MKPRRGWKGRTIRDKGVTETRSGFQSRISFEGHRYYLGTYRTAKLANLAYLRKLVALLTEVIEQIEATHGS